VKFKKGDILLDIEDEYKGNIYEVIDLPITDCYKLKTIKIYNLPENSNKLENNMTVKWGIEEVDSTCIKATKKTVKAINILYGK